MSYKKLVLEIKGMHCRSCEIVLEQNIGKVKGVREVKVNYKKGIAEIEAEKTPSYSELESAVSKAGYTIGKQDKKGWISRNLEDYLELGAVAMILFVLYLSLKMFGFFGFDTQVGSAPGIIGVLIIGLTAGISTCMALIGGLVLGISARHAEKHPEATAAQRFRPHMFFNAGRLISYVLFGGLIGLLGSVLQLSNTILGFLTLILSGVMLFMGLKLIGIFPRLENSSITLPKSISKLFGLHNEVKEYSHRGSFLVGALTFFVPCGFTQAMQLYAVSTGSFVQGAMIMGIFALGTMPGLLGIGGLTSVIKGAFARYFFRFAGVLVLVFTYFNFTSGMTVVQGMFSGDSGIQTAVTNIERGEQQNKPEKQVIEMTQSMGGYSPRQFTVKKGVPVVWKINSTSQFTCASYVGIPAYRIGKRLEPGENIIEFTPSEVGKVRFSCSMGMYSGIFNVVE